MISRRNFIHLSGAAALVGALPVATAAHGERTRFRLFRLQDGAYRPTDACTGVGCGDDTVRIRVGGPVCHAEPVLASLQVSFLFDAAGAPATPFVATRYTAGPGGMCSAPSSFVARRDIIRGLTLSYRLQGVHDCDTEHCRLTAFDQPLLQPGRYVLVSPDPHGRMIGGAALAASEDPLRPLSVPSHAPAFDYLPFAIEPVTPAATEIRA